MHKEKVVFFYATLSQPAGGSSFIVSLQTWEGFSQQEASKPISQNAMLFL